MKQNETIPQATIPQRSSGAHLNPLMADNAIGCSSIKHHSNKRSLTMKTLITFEKGTQRVHLTQGTTGIIHVMHEDKNGLTQFPIKYYGDRHGHSKITYDHPERVNKGIKPLIERAFHAKHMIDFCEKYKGYHGISKGDKYTLALARELANKKLIKWHEDTLQIENLLKWVTVA